MRQECSLSIGLVMSLLIFSSVSFAKVDEWTEKADMPTERRYLSTSEVGGKIYAIGGMNLVKGGNGGVDVNRPTVEADDPEADKWTKKADMLSARYAISSERVNNKI